MNSPHGDAASHNTDHPDDDRNGEDENGEEGTDDYRPHAASGDQGFRDDMRFRQRAHKPWLESDEQRLLSYRDKMGMDWDEIVFRLGRSERAVKLHYNTLRKKDS